MKLTFLGLPDHPQAKVALIPAPLEITTSWQKGTKEAPTEILKVSPNLEFFDEETELEPQEVLGFFTFPVPELPFDIDMALDVISKIVRETLEEKRFPILIGGEHTVTLGSIKSLKEVYKNLKILHLDAHLDLRDEYLGCKFSHATVVRRIYEMGIPVLSVGVRTLSKEEYEFIKKTNFSLLWMRDLRENWDRSFKIIEDFLKEGEIYLSLDMDVFDPSIAPGVGTPEPGGMSWYEFLQIIKLVVRYNLIGMDIVETKPVAGNAITEYLAAKIIFKISSYLAKKYETS
ncbi:MAG: agmatinase [Thermodesulfobacterium geofontis]|uniref:Agmatinase n=1 Tax=Thermodesulfobacterium geofontis TaxID=1295609 RepID=A0A2N7PPI7_9BACT|nr:MAG: agmatinase [Thermodesulfobacterium geofontis]